MTISSFKWKAGSESSFNWLQCNREALILITGGCESKVWTTLNYQNSKRKTGWHLESCPSPHTSGGLASYPLAVEGHNKMKWKNNGTPWSLPIKKILHKLWVQLKIKTFCYERWSANTFLKNYHPLKHDTSNQNLTTHK